MQVVPQALYDSMCSIMPEAVTLVVTVGDFATSETQGATLTASVGVGPSFSVGNACPVRFETKFDYDGADLSGQPVTVGWKTDDSAVYPLFSGTIATAETVGGVTSITAYDALFSSAVYKPSATVLRSCTGAQALADIAQALGVALDSATTTAAQKITLPEGLTPLGDATPAQAAGTVAALMGGNAIINRAGKLVVKTWADTGWTAEAMSGAGIAQTAPYTVTGLTFVRKRLDTSGPISTDTLETYTAGTGGITQENALATVALTNGAYNAIKSIPAFFAGSYTLAGGLLLESGDVFDVLTASGTYRVFAAQVVTMLAGGCNTGVSCWGASVDGRPASPTAQTLKKLTADLAEFQQLTANYAKITTAEVETLKIGAATIEGTVDGLTARVTATETVANSAKNAIDNLSVGGRNLIERSKLVEAVRKNATNNWLSEKDPVFKNTAYGFEQIQQGGVFTLSFDYEINGITTPTSAYLNLRNAASLRTFRVANLPRLEEGDNSGHVQASFTPDAAAREYGKDFMLSGFGAGKNAGAEIKLSNIKLERGTIATDWTPAPEDTESAVERVTERVATVEQTAEGLKTRVSATEQTADSAKSAIDNLSVGGRNLLLKTDFPSNIKLVSTSSLDFSQPLAYYNADSYRHIVYDNMPNDIEFTLGSTSNIGVVGRRLASEIALDPDSYYTLSAWVKVSVAGMQVARVLTYRTTGNSWVYRGGANVVKIPDADKWTFIQLTFKPDADTYAISYGFTCNYGNNAKFSIRHMKLEKGTIATDWTPAPEDMDKRIAKAESSIEQNADNIALRVAKTDYNGQTVASLINQSAEGIKIKGEKIEIEGNTVFKAVSETASSAKNAIDNLSVGGRNLIERSKLVEAVRKNATNNWLFEKDPVFKNTAYGFEQIQQGGVFTLSFDYEINGITSAMSLAIALRRSATSYSSVLALHLDVRDNSGHFSGQFTPTDEMMQFGKEWLLSGFGAGKNAGAEIKLSNIKLEIGTIATDWTPAPEDTESEIATALETAQRKSTAYHQGTAPTGADVQNGDVWFDTQGGGIYNRVNGQWTAHEVGTVSIADGSVTADKITVDQLFANAVLSKDIQAEKLNIGVDYGHGKNTYSITTSETGYIAISSGVNGIPNASYFHVAPSNITLSSPGIELAGQWDGSPEFPASLLIGGNRPAIKPYSGNSYPIPLIQRGIADLMLWRNDNTGYGAGIEIAFPTAFPDGTTPTVVFSPAVSLPEVCRLTASQISAAGFFVGAEYLSETAVTIPIHWVAFA